jgi:hypothetical protein
VYESICCEAALVLSGGFEYFFSTACDQVRHRLIVLSQAHLSPSPCLRHGVEMYFTKSYRALHPHSGHVFERIVAKEVSSRYVGCREGNFGCAYDTFYFISCRYNVHKNKNNIRIPFHSLSHCFCFCSCICFCFSASVSVLFLLLLYTY